MLSNSYTCQLKTSSNVSLPNIHSLSTPTRSQSVRTSPKYTFRHQHRYSNQDELFLNKPMESSPAQTDTKSRFRQIASTSISKAWQDKLGVNSRSVPFYATLKQQNLHHPPTTSSATEHVVSTPIHHRPKSPSKHISRVQAPTASGITYPYQLAFSTIENLLLPTGITQSSPSLKQSLLQLKICATLFDTETGRFFGKTWISPVPMTVHTGKVQHDRHSPQTGGSLKTQNTKIRSNDSSQNGFSDEDSCDSSDSRGLNGIPDGANLISHRVTVGASRICLYFHTPVKSPHVAIAIEFVFSIKPCLQDDMDEAHNVDNNLDQEGVSAGWTLIYPFNPQRNGLNVSKAWRHSCDVDDKYHDHFDSSSDSDNSDIGDQRPKVAQIFRGSPRVLPFIYSQLCSAVSGHAGLFPLLNAVITYRLLTRPDLQPACHLWKENVFIAPGDEVPGIETISIRGISMHSIDTARISRIGITVYPSIEQYESKLLDCISRVHYDNDPESLTPDENGILPSPVILERRLHIGFHNTFTFIRQPTVVTLKPLVHSDFKNEQLIFMGTVELDNFVPDDPSVAVIFLMEYKVLLTVNAPAIKKRKGIAGIIDKLASSDIKRTEPMQPTINIEKLISTGWGAYSPKKDTRNQEHVMYLETQTGINPFGSLIYTPKSVVYSGNQENYKENELDEANRHQAWPLALSFSFNPPTHEPLPVILEQPVVDHLATVPVVFEPVPQICQKADIIPKIEPEQSNQLEVSPPPKPLVKPSTPVDESENESDEEVVAASNLESAPVEVFTPFPVPLATHLRQRLSRMERARLHNAGFEMLLDDNHCAPTEIQLNNVDPVYLASNLELEFNDPLMNDVTILFQGLSFCQDTYQQLDGRFPTSVYFSFQFFTFPYTTTEKMNVYDGLLPAKTQSQTRSQKNTESLPHKRSTSVPAHCREWSHASHTSRYSFNPSAQGIPGDNLQTHITPGILYRYNREGFPAYDQPPGIALNYKVKTHQDPVSYTFRSGPNAIANYLCQSNMFIDVWDGDTLLHLGSGCVNLKPALRQGRSSIYFEDDVDIVWSEYADLQGPNFAKRSRSSSMGLNGTYSSGSTMHVNDTGLLKTATLHMRVTNIGRKYQEDINTTPQNAFNNPSKTQSQEEVIVHDYRYHINRRQKTFHEPKLLSSIDHELHQILNEAHADRTTQAANCTKALQKTTCLDSSSQYSFESRNQKLIHHATGILKNLKIEPDKLNLDDDGANKELAESFSYRRTREERDRDLKTIDVYRERRRKGKTQEMLLKEITVSHTIHPTFAQATYLEFEFTNPYSTDHTFKISWQDKEFRVVTNTSEWIYHRRLHGLASHVEAKLIHTSQDEATPEIFLERNETVFIPFIFQSFLGGPISLVGGNHATDEMNGRDVGGNNFLQSPGIYSRCIHVSFLNSQDQPAAILALNVCPRPYYIDRVIRLFRGEHEVIRKVMKFPLVNKISHINSNSTSTLYDTSNPTQVYIRCNSADAVCTLETSQNDSAMKEVTFKYRARQAPETKAVYILFYNDPFHTFLNEIWRVFVHSLYRFDMNSTLCQTNSASLVLRGTSKSRLVNCYSSLPREIMVGTDGPFMLTANALNEVSLVMRPQDTRTKEAIVNIVDINSGFLVSSWLVVSHCSLPEVTKTFELVLPRDKQASKRVSYTNPFFHRKMLYLRTDSPHLVQFKEPVLDLESAGSQYICMRFIPGHHLPKADILVFLNDESDKIEECLSLSIRYM
ncbi:hypothetical protein QVD99_007683 [Batrachochytrium dendrobatidis]|nr:hypothetical protein QVD99_007683 [Batrachochytrium dendrobatidis]